MLTDGWTKRLALTLVTIAVAFVPLSPQRVLAQSSSECNTNDPDAPCFANNLDILGGQKQHNLLRTDDLVLLKIAPQESPPGPVFDEWQLNSANSILSTTGTFLSVDVNTSSTPMTRVVTGRMFNVGKDTVIAPVAGNTPFIFLHIAGLPTNEAVQTTLANASINSMSTADFTGDGFSEFVVNFGTGSMQVATAADVNTPFTLKWGPVAHLDPLMQMAVGDFNGDGQPEIAGLSGCVSQAAGCSLNIYTVDPTTLTITRAASLPLSTLPGWLTAGRFGTPNYDQLATLTLGSGGKGFTVQAYDFANGSLQPIPKGVATANFANASAATGFFGDRFLPGAFDQVIAVAAPTKQSTVALGFLTFSHDSNLIPAFVGGGVQLPSLGVACPFDVAVGDFNRTQSGQYSPLLNIAVAGTDCGSNAKVQVFTVNPNGNASSVSYTSPQTLTFSAIFQSTGTYFRLAAGDLQGRSLPVGPPEKATVTNHIQPDIILGVPPMHVDWITPAGGSVPSIVNVSVFPQTFNTAYNFQTTTGTQASRQTSTSYTMTKSETAEESIEYKALPEVDFSSGASLQLKQAAAQTHENTVSNAYDTNQGQSMQLTAATEFDDRVAATANQGNFYSYPVLGQCTDSPGAAPQNGCPADKTPVLVQFGGPDNVYYVDLANGRALEWYQPVHEPGNIFSYPGSLTQLQEDQPQQQTTDGQPTGSSSLQLLSPSNVLWDPQANEQVAINWTSGGGTDVSSGSTDTHSLDTSETVSGSKTFFGGVARVSASFEFGYNTSTSSSSQDQTSTTFSKSSGVVLNRGISGPTSSSTYLYAGQAFIFGRLAPPDTVQSASPPDTDVQAQGALAVGYAADPLSTGIIQSGEFWKQAYTVAPDVALNHPQRWHEENGQVQFNCPVGFTSSLDQPACTPISQAPTPVNVADALFYQMKGLFVTPGDNITDGPQITQTVQGKTVTLRARVYNYSLANMTDDTKVHVQFYAQPWDSTAGQFLSQPGNPNAFAPAVFIGEDDLAPIPAFCGGAQGSADPCLDADAPRNWVFAQTTWDTSTVATNTDWKFWVVVWMERNGQKVAEIQDHGLAAIPGSNLTSLADVPVETYSNNLGFYNQVFHVGSIEAAVPSTSTDRHLESTWVSLPREGSLLQHQHVTVRARHRAFGAPLDDVLVLFYDGDPANHGELFDVENIPHISANATWTTAVPFTPRTCGPHQLVVQAIPTNGKAKPATDTIRVGVDCPPPSLQLRQFHGTAEHVGSGTNNGQLQLSGKVVGLSGALDLGASMLGATTLRLTDLLRETLGAGELVRGSFGPLLPLRLTARPGSSATAALFATPPSAGAPTVRVEFTQRDPRTGTLDFTLTVERAVIAAPRLCGHTSRGSTTLRTRFSLTGGVHGSVAVSTEQPWQCKGDQLKTP